RQVVIDVPHTTHRPRYYSPLTEDLGLVAESKGDPFSVSTGGGSRVQAWADQDARLTVITLNRGSRSMWTSKTKRLGQVGSVRSSATVLATSTSTLRLSR